MLGYKMVVHLTCLIDGNRRRQIFPLWNKALGISIHHRKTPVAHLHSLLPLAPTTIAKIVIQIRQITPRSYPVTKHNTLVSPRFVRPFPFQNTHRYHNGWWILVGTADLLVWRYRRAVLQRVVRVRLGHPRGVGLAPGATSGLLGQDIVALVANPCHVLQVLQTVLEIATLRTEDVAASSTVVAALDHRKLLFTMKAAGGLRVRNPQGGLLTQPRI